MLKSDPSLVLPLHPFQTHGYHLLLSLPSLIPSSPPYLHFLPTYPSLSPHKLLPLRLTGVCGSDESIYRIIDISSSISIYRIDIVEKISTFST
jgi:hypothetical protein